MTSVNDSENQPSKPRRLWLIGLIVLLSAAGVYFSMQKQSSMQSDTVMFGNGKPKLLDFGMGVCAQCKRMKPVMAEVAVKLKGQVDVHVLDIRNEKNEELAEKYGMKLIPYIILTDHNGRLLWSHQGFIDANTLLENTKTAM